MNDGVLVRVLHRLAHRAKQPQPFFYRGFVGAAILGKRHAVDVLHGEPWIAVGERVGVVDARDQGVIQLRQRPLLTEEALAARRRQPGVAEEFDGHPCAEFLALGQVDYAHAAFSQHMAKPVRSQLAGGDGRLAQHVAGRAGQSPVEQRAGLRVFLEHGEHLRHEFAVAAARGCEVGCALSLRKLRRLQKQRLNPFYTRRVHHCDWRSLCLSHARATLHSRCTVASETSSNVAVSETSSPPKNRLSTTNAWRGSSRSNSRRASSSASMSRAQVTAMDSSKVTKAMPSPRFCAFLRRAASTRTWRMARAAMRLKCSRDVLAKRGEPASFATTSRLD